MSVAGFRPSYGLVVGTGTTSEFKSLSQEGTGFSAGSVSGTMSAKVLRGSWYQNRYYFMEWNWGSAPVIKSVNSSGQDLQTFSPANAITGLANTFLEGTNGTYARIIRPCALLRISSGDMIVAYSSYQYHQNINQMVATINFFLVKSSGGAATLLNTVIQYDMEDVGYSDAVYGTGNQHITYDPGASRIQALFLSSGKYLIVANDGTKAVRFIVTNGIESMAEPIIPIDLDANRLQITDSVTGKKIYSQYNTFLPTSLFKSDQGIFLNGIMTRRYSNGDFNTLETYCVSTDGINWSVGELSSFIHSFYTKYNDFASAKTMNFSLSGVYEDVENGQTVKRMYAFGTNCVSYATAREKDIDYESDGTDFSNIVVSGSVQMASNSSDALNFIALRQLEFLGTSNSISPSDLAGKTVSVEMGFKDDAGNEHGAKIGEYLIEAESRSFSVMGKEPSSVNGIDAGSWKLTKWFSITDVDRWSSVMIKDDMKALSKIIVKGIHDGYKVVSNATSQGMYLKNINDPMVALTSTRDDRDGMFLASVTFPDTGDDNHLSSFGIVFGAEDYTDIYTSGKRDRKGFNAFMVPVVNNWTNHNKTAPQMRVSNLRRRGDDPETELYEMDVDLAWIWKRRYTSLWEREEYSTNEINPLTTITSDASVSGFVNSSTFSFLKNQEYEIVGRKQGNLYQLFVRKKSRVPADMVSQAHYEYTKIAEYRFGRFNRASWGPRPYWGFVAGTDTFTTVEGWNAAEYENIESTLTEAYDTDTYLFNEQINRFNQLVVSGGWTQNNTGSPFASPAFNTWPGTVDIKVGETVRVRAMNGEQGTNDYLARVSAIYKTGGNPNRIEFDNAWTGLPGALGAFYNNNPGVGNFQSYVYKVDVSPTYGFASSGSVSINAVESISGTSTTDVRISPIEIRTGAPKQSNVTAGRGIFINRQNDAMSIRFVETDGSFHKIYSASPTGLAWDEVNPVSYVWTSGSVPPNPSTREWRLVMHQGRLLPISTNQINVPTGDAAEAKRRYMIKGDEIVRYVNMKTLKRGSATEYTEWCIIPTYYTPIFPGQKGSQTIQQWSIETSYGNGVWKSPPGDRFSDIFSYSLPGLRLTIQGKNEFSRLLSEPNYYAVSASAGNGTSVASTLTFSPALFTGAENVDPNKERAKEYDKQVKELAVLSGRNQFESPSTGLGVGEPLCYYPIGPNETKDFDHLIKIGYWQMSSGLYNSAKENIKFICNMAGIRDVSFQDKEYTVNANSSLVLNKSGVAINQSSFVVELSGLFGGGRQIRIDFRSSYYASMSVSGSSITLTLGILAGFSKATSAGINSESILARVTIPVSNFSIEGQHDVCFVVKKEKVSFEMDRMPVWTFDLSEYTHGGTLLRDYSFYEERSGPIKVYADSTYPLSVKWIELNDEVENQIIDMSMSSSAAVQFITGERHIYARTTQNGGLHFSRFIDGNRDQPTTAIPTQKYISDQLETNPYTVPGHILVTGAEYAESIDPDWIRENGYMFGTGQNRLLDTVEDSIREASLLMRMGKEDSDVSNIMMTGMVHLQPEDQIQKQYTDPDGNSVNDQSVVTSHSIEFGPAALRSSIQARTKYEMV